MLPQQRFPNDQRIKRRDKRSDRQPINRRRCDQRQFPNTRQRQLQRPRDRCGRQCQYVNVGFELLEPLLVLDAEMLFLIDDQQPEIAELNGFAQERMCPDDNIDGPVRDTFLCQCQLLRGHQARGMCNIDWQAVETFRKRFVMLTRKQRGRHNDCDLTSRHGS